MRVVYKRANICLAMDEALDGTAGKTVGQFVLTSEEWYEFLTAYDDRYPGIVHFRRDELDRNLAPPSEYSYRGIPVIQEPNNAK